MRPLRLEFQAFGSYPGTEVVDFVALAKRGLFVVTGPTGTGKSTIFDAMVFALYGELPGSRTGNSGEARSHHADANVETSVTFDFEVDGRHFRVTRKPQQERPKQRGVGTTTQPAAAIIVELKDGGIASQITQMRNVTVRCEELVGLDVSQFQRVVLLPQGAFTAFLLAKEADREALLRPLFGGQVYAEATEWLKKEARRLDELVAESDRAMGHHVLNAANALAMVALAWGNEELLAADLVEAGDAAMQERIEALTGTRAGHRAAVEQFEARANGASENAATAEKAAELFDKAQAARQRVEQLGLSQASMEADRGRAQASSRARPVVAASVRVQRAGEAVAKAKAALDALVALVRRGFEEIARPVPEMSPQAVSTAVAKAAQELRADEALLGVASAAQQASNDADRLVEREGAAVVAADEAFAAAQHAVGVQQADIAALEPVAVGVPLRKVEVDAAKQVLNERERLHGARTRLEQAETAERSSKMGYEAVMARFVATQAPRLAETLTDNCPCPVCGSIEHPAPAQFADGEQVDHEVVDAARAMWSREQAAVAGAVQEVAQLVESLGDAASDDVAVLKARHADAAAAYAQAQQAEQSLGSLRASLGNAEASAKALEQNASSCRTALAVAEADAVAKRAALQVAQAACAHVNPKALGMRLAVVAGLEQELAVVDGVFAGVTGSQATLEGEQSGLEAALQASGYATVDAAAAACLEPAEESRLVHAVEAFDNEFRDVAAQLRAYEEQGIPGVRPDAESMRLVAVEERRLAKDAATAFTTASNALASASTELEAARRVGAASAADRVRRDSARKVHRTCNGDAGFRVKLERWVLARELERVTMAANVHLGRMSNGRYRLERDNTQGGLKLDVHDVHTGRGRATNSLSGGEQFQASLSLALGLADVVSLGGAGSGRQFDALFVDEGFGSLDQDALGDAIDALEMIQATGRMVGAITHVEEMKNRLHKGIEVSRLPNGRGSTLRVNP